MVQKLETLIESASQTAGPYVHIGLMPTYAGNAGYYDEEIGTTPFLDESKANQPKLNMPSYDPGSAS